MFSFLFTVMTESHYYFVNSLNDCELLIFINISESTPNPLPKKEYHIKLIIVLLVTAMMVLKNAQEKNQILSFFGFASSTGNH